MPATNGRYAMTLGTITDFQIYHLRWQLANGVTGRDIGRKNIMRHQEVSLLRRNDWDPKKALAEQCESTARTQAKRQAQKLCISCTRWATESSLRCVVCNQALKIKNCRNQEARAPIHPCHSHLKHIELALLALDVLQTPDGETGLAAWTRFGKSALHALWHMSREVEIDGVLYADYYPDGSKIPYDFRPDTCTVRMRWLHENQYLKGIKEGIPLEAMREWTRMNDMGYEA